MNLARIVIGYKEIIFCGIMHLVLEILLCQKWGWGEAL